MTMRVLLVEDDALLGAGLRAALGKAGFDVSWVKDGATALDKLEAEEFVALVLDIGLPTINGIEVLCEIRARHNPVPVLILTAADTTRDKVKSFECGADDFLAKTAEMEELVARIRALIRRSGHSSGTLCAGPLKLNLDTHTLTKDGAVVKVSKREFSVLQALMEGAGRVLTRGQLEQSMYGWKGSSVDSNAIEVHIHNLRLKIGAATLHTIRGVGYTIVKQER